MTTFSWSATCTSSLKSLGGVPDYADSSLPLLGPLANMNSSFELDFVAGRCIDKHKKLVPYKTSGVRVDDIKAECTRRGLRVANTRSECVEILERSDGRDWNMCVEDFVLTDLDKKMPALIDTAEDKFSTWTWEKTVAILRQLRDAEGLVLLDLKLPAGKARETAKWLARSMLAMAAASDWVDPEEYKEPDLDPEDEEEDESEDDGCVARQGFWAVTLDFKSGYWAMKCGPEKFFAFTARVKREWFSRESDLAAFDEAARQKAPAPKSARR